MIYFVRKWPWMQQRESSPCGEHCIQVPPSAFLLVQKVLRSKDDFTLCVSGLGCSKDKVRPAANTAYKSLLPHF